MNNHFTFWSFLKNIFEGSVHNPPQNGRRVVLEGNGRSGFVNYIDGAKSTRFYSELGGGQCIFYMVIPAQNTWESETGYALANREEILHFIAEESLKKQTGSPGAFYKIEEKHILFMNKED